MLGRLFLAAIIAVFCFGAAPAWALKLIPFVAEFEPKGQGANKTFRLENDTDEPSAVQLTMVHREMTVDGQDQLKDADDDFVVFPPRWCCCRARGARCGCNGSATRNPRPSLPTASSPNSFRWN